MNKTRYDGSSEGWRRIDGQSDAAARYLEMMNRMLAEQKRQSMDFLELEPGMSAIEIGCGLGLDAEALAARVGPTGRVVGIDASQDLIGEATRRAASLGLPLSFQVDDAQALAFPANSFDAARVDRVLQHLSDPAQAVREMARVVRPGGRLA
jgi:ubiquinone/menaquinone biosynthesis C-methylase UbiE